MTRPAEGDDAWLLTRLGPELTDALWPYLQLAEAQRLLRVHGYPKDNALPPPMSTRLQDADFKADLRDAILDDDEIEDASTLLDAIARLM